MKCKIPSVTVFSFPIVIIGLIVMSQNIKPVAARHLFELDHGGYPTWVSNGDRELLAQLNNYSANDKIVPNVTVAKDGSGDFKTILEAINSYPKNNQGRFVIYIKAGVYTDEYIKVDETKVNILLYGDGPTNTIISGSKNSKDGIQTMQTATFTTAATDFIAMSIAFENTAGSYKGPAVALSVQGDRSAFYNCAIHGYQDTLLVYKNRQFYRECEISGTIDFIFGFSTTLIQKSKITVRKPLLGEANVVVADGTSDMNKSTGIVIHNCEISPDSTLFPDRFKVKTYLARPWKAFSTAVFLENNISDMIQPEGYIPWNPEEPNTQNCYFAEFGNTGPGADAKARATFAKGIISKDEASKFTAEQWLQASTWLPSTGISFDPGFKP